MYNPLDAEITEDLVIGAQTYILTSYDPSHSVGSEINLQNSDGSWRGRILNSGEITATFGIECANKAQPAPQQFQTFTYPLPSGATWVIKDKSKSVSNSAAPSWTLNCGWVSGVNNF